MDDNIKEINIQKIKWVEASYVAPVVDGYKPFDGENEALQISKIIGIKINCQEVICGIQFVYEQGEGEIYGYMGESDKKLTLDFDEYITQINWSTAIVEYFEGDTITEITFVTNKGTTFTSKGGTYENSKACSIKAPSNHAIIAIAGYAKEYLNAITKGYTREMETQFYDNDIYYDDYFSIIDANNLTKIVVYSGLIIDNLHFIYDNDPSLTNMHGEGRGTRYEFILDEDEYITNFSFDTAYCPNLEYGESPVLCCVEFKTNKNRKFYQGYNGDDFEKLSTYLQGNFVNKESYSYEIEEGCELFCLAGVHTKYMGKILKIYTRTVEKKSTSTLSLQSRKASNKRGAKQKNSNGKTILFINHIKKMDQNNPVIDTSVKPIVDYFMTYYKKNLEKSVGYKCDILPNPINNIGDLTKCAIIKSFDVKKALLSGQYEYISIKSHGTLTTCGNPYATLFDTEWVRDNKEKLKDSLKNTTISFFCCECGFRGTEKLKDVEYEGLARELIKAGARAVFAYSTSLTSGDPVKSIYLRSIFQRFVTNHDRHIILGVAGDSNPSPNAAAKYILKEYDALLSKLKSEYTLNDDLIKKLTEDNPAMYAGGNPDDLTSKGLAKTTDGVDFIEKLIDRDKTPPLDLPSVKGSYKVYAKVLLNKSHFCGPGDKDADKTAKRDNQGELCNEYGNSDKPAITYIPTPKPPKHEDL